MKLKACSLRRLKKIDKPLAKLINKDESSGSHSMTGDIS